ncbi:glycoside hydrolase family 43 protein [Botryobacter ruber]|uniref:glycoside hydrolase family 43 protein n=1 Tax=Botryobacter ruber TaxID=2171629 RepID=UPI000E0A0D2B|nr:glycoside hydrolase family 43 protein [Botryobacter ruber]
MKFSAFSFTYARNYFFCLVLLSCAVSCKPAEAQQKTAVSQGNDILLADPTMFFHKGTYYLYGTGGNTGQGFLVYTSKDMQNWEGPAGKRAGFAFKKGDGFGDAKFWAPQVFQYNNKFHMAYVANESIAIAESDSPLGPFTQKDKKALAAPVRQIDPFLFVDDDGKKYMYHVRVADGGNRMFVAEMTDDLSAMKMETLKECIRATDTWENTENDAWSVTEGPTVLKHKGTYYFIYSANHFKWPSYAVGYATSKSPYGPWKKYEGNPIISKANIGQNGTGHGDVVQDKKGNMFYVFHTHQSATEVGPRKTAVVKLNFSKDANGGPDKLSIDENSFHFLKSSESHQ